MVEEFFDPVSAFFSYRQEGSEDVCACGWCGIVADWPATEAARLISFRVASHVTRKRFRIQWRLLREKRHVGTGTSGLRFRAASPASTSWLRCSETTSMCPPRRTEKDPACGSISDDKYWPRKGSQTTRLYARIRVCGRTLGMVVLCLLRCGEQTSRVTRLMSATRGVARWRTSISTTSWTTSPATGTSTRSTSPFATSTCLSSSEVITTTSHSYIASIESFGAVGSLTCGAFTWCCGVSAIGAYFLSHFLCFNNFTSCKLSLKLISGLGSACVYIEIYPNWTVNCNPNTL